MTSNNNFTHEYDGLSNLNLPKLVSELNKKGRAVVPGMFNEDICNAILNEAREKLLCLFSQDKVVEKLKHYDLIRMENEFDIFNALVNHDVSLARKIRKDLINSFGYTRPLDMAASKDVSSIVSSLLPDNSEQYLFALRLSLPGYDTFVDGVFPWHQDFDYFGNLAFWAPLEPCSPNKGSLRVISEIKTYFPHKQHPDHEGVVYIPSSELANLDVEYFDLQCGDAICFGPKTPHSSAINKSDKIRWAFVLWVK